MVRTHSCGKNSTPPVWCILRFRLFWKETLSWDRYSISKRAFLPGWAQWDDGALCQEGDTPLQCVCDEDGEERRNLEYFSPFVTSGLFTTPDTHTHTLLLLLLLSLSLCQLCPSFSSLGRIPCVFLRERDTFNWMSALPFWSGDHTTIPQCAIIKEI